MATGSQTLELVRAALESVEGTAVAPTRALYVPQGGIQVVYKKEGIIAELAWNKQDTVNDIMSGIETVGIAVTGVPGSFQDFGYWMCPFDAAFSGAPATVDTTAFSRTGAPSQTDNTMSATGVKSMSVQWSASDFIGTWGASIPGLIGEELTIDFKKRASGNDTGVTFDARYMTASALIPITAYTGTATDRTQTWAIGNMLKAYVDSTAANLGTTGDANITTAQFHIIRKNAYHDGMDNTGLHTSMHRPAGWETTLQFQRKFSDLTELNAYLGAASVKTLRAIRIEALGGQIGSVSAKNTIRLDFVGKHIDMDDVPFRQDGIWYANFTLRGLYDGTAGASWKLFTQSLVSAAYTTL